MGEEMAQQQQNGNGSTNDNFSESYPPGYRFCPYDEELIIQYLKKKVLKHELPINNIKEVNLYKHNPEDLTKMYKLYRQKEWYFFTPRDRKYPNGNRPNRAAGDGFWKATGTDKKIYSNGQLVGYKNALVYHKGKPPKGKKTSWVMHEYKVVDEPNPQTIRSTDKMRLDDWVLCRLKKQEEKKKRQDDGSKQMGDSKVFDERSAPVNKPDPSAGINYDIGMNPDGSLFAFDQVLQHINSGYPLESNHMSTNQLSSMTNMGIETENQVGFVEPVSSLTPMQSIESKYQPPLWPNNNLWGNMQSNYELQLEFDRLDSYFQLCDNFYPDLPSSHNHGLAN